MLIPSGRIPVVDANLTQLLLFLLCVVEAAGCGRSILAPSPEDTPELRAPQRARSPLGDEPPSRIESCGNGRLDVGEDCDGGLGIVSCQSLGLGEGEVTCHPTACRHDASNCSSATWTPIDCQGSGGCDNPPPPCGGMAGCDVTPPVCGDGLLDRGESCDGRELGGQSCAALGYAHGTLRCDGGCVLDASDCGYCGDGRRGGPEPCDGADVAGQDCVSFGLGEGPVRCTPDCEIDTSQCFRPPDEFCGDGFASSPEECDGADLAGRTCENLGLGQGRLGCHADCQLDPSQCFQSMQFCGDGFASFPEECDGGDLAGQSCASLTGVAGPLRCGPGCRFDVSGCQDPMQQDCAQCALRQCADQTDACLATPGCLEGITCWVQQCGGFNDPQCVIQCFGGDIGALQVAIQTFQCLQSGCPGACGV